MSWLLVNDLSPNNNLWKNENFALEAAQIGARCAPTQNISVACRGPQTFYFEIKNFKKTKAQKASCPFEMDRRKHKRRTKRFFSLEIWFQKQEHYNLWLILIWTFFLLEISFMRSCNVTRKSHNWTTTTSTLMTLRVLKRDEDHLRRPIWMITWE